MAADYEHSVMRKVAWRLVPFLSLAYLINALDRFNISIAALTMNKALGLTATMFGFGAGIFFLTYFVFELPSNLFLDKFGARKWIARIMISWGILSGLMAFIPNLASGTGLGNEMTFYTVRPCSVSPKPDSFPASSFT